MQARLPLVLEPSLRAVAEPGQIENLKNPFTAATPLGSLLLALCNFGDGRPAASSPHLDCSP
jgi:hypothetical protein